MARSSLQNIVIVLVETKSPGNIGSVARAMHNMGLDQLRLANPQCSVNEESFRMARGGAEILSKATRYSSLRSALRGIRMVVGTSGKTGGNRAQAVAPGAAAPKVLTLAGRQKIGILFGPEDTGLVDDHLLLCQMLVRIPTHPRGRSLNLAQSVMIIAYELFVAQLPRQPARIPRLASVEQVEAMYTQLEAALLQIGFLHRQNARHMMFALRRVLGRAGLEAPDVGILRGIARQIRWYSQRVRNDE